MLKIFVGSDPRNYKIARKEKYIDEDGAKKEAVSYNLEGLGFVRMGPRRLGPRESGKITL